MGNGRYSALLTYAQWHEFNCAQRAHQNYVEQAASVVILVLAAGLYLPKFAAACGAAYMLGRALYSAGYASGGPAGRLVGAIILDIALVALFVAAVWQGAQHAGVVDAVTALLPPAAA